MAQVARTHSVDGNEKVATIDKGLGSYKTQKCSQKKFNYLKSVHLKRQLKRRKVLRNSNSL